MSLVCIASFTLLQVVRADPPNGEPVVTLNVPAQAFIGSNVAFSATFDNQNTTTGKIGYGPFIDVILDSTGTSGTNGLGNASISATYNGQPIPSGDFFVVPFTDDGTGHGIATHPFLVDSTGAHVVVHAPAGYGIGDRLVVVRLPFGSFTPDQPAAPVDFIVDMSSQATLGTALNIDARGGYEFGFTPLNDFCCGDDPSQSVSGWTSGSVTPVLVTLAKTYDGPEGETATGQNFQHHYTVSAEIAPGQTINNLVLSDALPNDVQFVAIVPNAMIPSDANCSLPSTSTPGGTLSCTIASAFGTIDMEFTFYIPRVRLGGATVLNASTGDDATSCNNASITGGTWPNPTPTVNFTTSPYNPGGCEYTLTDKSIAIQKTVSGTPRPEAVLTYTLNVQVSDYFAFNNIDITDILSDGQHFDPSFTPRMSVTGRGFSMPTADFDGANYVVDESRIDLTDGPPPAPENPATDGTTHLLLHVSNEVARRALTELPSGTPAEIAARNHALAGRMLGGCVPLGGSATPDCGPTDNVGTTVTIVFHAIVQHNFTDVYPSGDWSVDQGDYLDNNVTALGNVLDTSTFNPTTFNEDDTSASKVTIATGTLTKSIFAINHTECPDAVVCPTGGPYQIKPGDTVTYRITYNLPTSDEENLAFTDYLPLPIFDATEVAPPFDAVGQSSDPTPVIPLAGHANFGQLDTFHDYSSITPTLATSASNNSVSFTYGDFDDVRDQSTTVDILFTVTVSNAPFADGLYLTNQARAREGSTQLNAVDSNAIVQVVLTEPLLVSKKGIVATDHTGTTFNPSPAYPGSASFHAPGSSPSWTGTISSSDLAANPIDSDVSGVDAGDRITFAIVIENQGSSSKGAFDLTLHDTYDAMGFITPTTGTMNMQIRYGDGSVGPAFTKPDGSAAAATDLFGSGIRLVDPDTDHGACQAHTIGPGKNIIVITYDLQLSSSVEPGIYANSSALVHYAGSEGGPNFLSQDETDEAHTQVKNPVSVKSIDHTEINTAFNDDTEAVIGEMVYYKTTITVPEGELTSSQLQDNLDSGLAFVACDSITAATGVSVTGTCAPADVTVSSGGAQVLFNLGTIINSNTDNGATDNTVVINYHAIIDNVASNIAGVRLNNSAVFSWNGQSLLPASAPNVTVLEPALTNTKQAYIDHDANGFDSGDTTGDAGDAVRYVITLSHANSTYDTDAFDVSYSDTLPALIDGPFTWSVVDSGGPVTAADFEIDTTGGINTLQTKAGHEFDFALSATRTITITVDGTLDVAAHPYSTISNTGTVRWSSLQGDQHSSPRSPYGTNPVERTGTGVSPDTYFTPGTGSFNTISATPSKTIIATSEQTTPAETAPYTSPYLAIGEIVRYRLVVELPEGTGLNYELHDSLSPYLQYLNDGTAKVAFVSNGSGCGTQTITSSTLSGAGLWVCGNDPTGVTPTFAIASASTDFALGDLVNSDSDFDKEYVILEFNALMENDLSNQNDNTARGNSFQVYTEGAARGTSATVDVYAAEPVITIAKTIPTAPVDAGDAVQYQLVITNTSSGNTAATAHDLSISDPVGAWINLQSVSITSCPVGVTCTDGSTTGINGTVSVSADYLNPSGSITVRINGVVLDGAPGGLTITNTGTVTWTSLPGAQGSPSTNPTGSQTPGTSGTATGERNGTGGAGTLNDYTASDTKNTNLFQPSVTKSPLSQSATIGQTVTFNLKVQLPEGVTQSLVVTDLLPNGLSYQSYQIITDHTLSGGILTADFSGAPLIGTLTSSPPPGSSGEDLVLSFGDVTVPPDGSTTDDSFLVQITAQVVNEFGNQNNTALSNQGRVSYTNPNPPGGTVNRTGAPVTVTVIEPILQLAKDVQTPPSPADAGGIITYHVLIDHAAASQYAASDVRFTDSLPAALALYVGDPIHPINVTAHNGAILGTDNSSGNTVDVSITSIPLGGSVEIVYSALLTGSVIPNSTYTNTGDVVWTSLPGSVAGERISGDGFYNNGTGSAVNDYELQDTASFNTGQATFSKTLTGTDQTSTSGSDVTIGEKITYTITVSLTEGHTNSLVVTDNLPLGLECVSGSPLVDVSGFGGTLRNESLSCAGGNGVDPVFTWSNIDVNGDNDPTNNSFTIAFQALVLDVPGNVGYGASPTTLSNDASIVIDSGTPSDTNSVDANVVEPHLTVSKTITPDHAANNDTVTFEIDVHNGGLSQANDIVINDPLPAASFDTFTPVTVPSGFTYAETSVAPNTVVSFTGDSATSIPAGESLTFRFTARVVDLPAGTTFHNVATVTQYSTLPGTIAGERAEPQTNGSADLGGISPDIAVTKSSPGSSYGPGEMIVYSIQVSNLGDRDASGVIVNETVPTHTRFNTVASAPTLWSCANGSVGGTACTSIVGALAAHSSTTLTFTVVVDNPLVTTDTTVVNTVSAVDDGTHGTDSDLTNNSDTETDALTNPSMAVVKSYTLAVDNNHDGISNPGDVLDWQIQITNSGSHDATNVIFTDSPDAHASLVVGSVTTTAGTIASGNTPGDTSVRVNIGTILAGGGSVTIHFQAAIENPLSSGVDNIRNTGHITGGNIPNQDSNEVVIPVTAAPDIRITKTDGYTEVSAGASLTYTLTVSNVGTQNATGVTVIDHIPDHTAFTSASSGGVYSSGDRTVRWEGAHAFNLNAGQSVTFLVTISIDNPLDPSVASITNTADAADDATNGPDLNPADNSASDMDIIGVGSKNLIGGNLTDAIVDPLFTTPAIGEVLHYEVRLLVGHNSQLTNVQLLDTLDRGLAFVRCDSITAAGGTLALGAGTLTDVCNAAIASRYPSGSADNRNDGRQIQFDFGNVSNTHPSEDSTLIVDYSVVVLDFLDIPAHVNLRGSQLRNTARWSWDSLFQIPLSTPPVTVIEPTLHLVKTADVNTAISGQTVTYTLTLNHTGSSNENAYDVVLSDILPSQLSYVPGSLIILSEPVPGAGTVDDTAAPTLRVSWPSIGAGSSSAIVQFQAKLVPNLVPDTVIHNSATLEWSSLPGDRSTPIASNIYSTERRYDPLTSADNYIASATLDIRTPRLPSTGFAPGRRSILPLMPLDRMFAELSGMSLMIPKLSVNIPIVGVPLLDGKWDLTWLGRQAGYLDGTAYPTQPGNAGITAHVYDAEGNPGPFYNLGTLMWGDPIWIYSGGQRYTYEVREVLTVSPDDLSLLGHEDYSWVTLFTCKDYDSATGEYQYRLAVRAVLTSVDPAN